MNLTTLFIFPWLYLLTALSAADSALDFDEHKNFNAEGGKRTASKERRDVASMVSEVLEDVILRCDKNLKERDDLEAKLYEMGRVVKNRHSDLSLNRMRNQDPNVRLREHRQWPFNDATHQLYRRFNLTRDEIGQTLTTVPFTGPMGRDFSDNCTQVIQPAECDENARYRTADEQCNNLQNPTYGSATVCQQRLLPAYYEGDSDFRTSVLGGDLPNPRTLSLNLHYHLNRPTNYVTHMYMFFGQLLDHDIALTPLSTTVNNEAIECCPPQELSHPQCRPIIVADDDPFYSQFGITCLNFVRSAMCPTCTMGPRQLMNQVTSFIDASFVYGNSANETAALRENDGSGRLRVRNSDYGDLLPASPAPNDDQCSFPETNDICFQAGDPRANQHTVLTSLHTIFVREHNRLADGLRRTNPRWNDERVFQEARRILAAEMQVITYKEYLPITLGNDRMSYFELWTGSSTRYSDQEVPTLILEFSTAAFRFGHSLVNSVVANNPLNATNQRRLLRDEFFQPFDLYRGFIGPLVRGASNSPAQWFDPHLVPDVTNFLYRIRGNQTGLDLAAININRGRDHGIPQYTDMVRYCSDDEIVISNFDDLERYSLMSSDKVEALRRNYRHVYDVDLWPGILMETPNRNAVVGPTAACIIGMQFHKLKFGDRFYFEHSNVGVRFTNRQKEELSRVTLSKIICLNTDVPNMSLNAMLFNSRNNPRITCSNVEGVNLSYWRE